MRGRLSWITASLLILLLAILIVTGWWQSGSSASQVQVPMFYDAHYLFPRAWTQEQAAPGIPPASPLSFFGKNRVSQTFVSNSGRLSMITVWLAGENGQRVEVSLVDDTGETRRGEVILTEGYAGDYYNLRFAPFENARGRAFHFTIAAPNASVHQPVVTRTVGGDRLGGSFSINEYNQPGNLQLQTYADGVFGRWWLDALGAQLLPNVFRLRLSQYKPEVFKGAIFSILLIATGGLSILYLVLARPANRQSSNNLIRALGWAMVIVLGLFLLWQVADRRLIFKPFANAATLGSGDMPLEKASAESGEERLVSDLVATLWTAERFPEERFVHTGTVGDKPGVKVPADSRIEYALVVLPASSLRVGVAAQGKGNMEAQIRVGESSAAFANVDAVAEPNEGDVTWLEVDLSPWAGQATRLVLQTEGDKEDLDGWWVMPQIASSSPWLLNDPLPENLDFEDAGYRFGNMVELVGYSVAPLSDAEQEILRITLYWRPLTGLDSYAKVFVHLLDDQGELVSQSDGEPINNAYPLPFWQPGKIVEDVHLLEIPPEASVGEFTIAVGLYDPDSLQRWMAVDSSGQVVSDGRAVLPAPKVSP